jgi:hypothetical protein
MPWYKKLENWLLPMQPVVIAGLIAIAILSVYFALQKSNTLRTAWFIYLISP